MQSRTFNRITMSSIRLLLLAGLVMAQAVSALADAPKREFTKNISREFSTTADGTTAIYNKYGKVNVNTWQNNSVKIEITIVVNAGDQNAADKMFDRIKVNFISTAGYIKAETMLENTTNNGIWPDGGTCQDFKINYDVWMPIGNLLDLKNKYGDSYVANLNGKLIAEIKYGNIRTEALASNTDLNLGYGKAALQKAGNLTGIISYGELSVTSAKDIQLDSKNSEYKIDKCDNARITSKYDDFTLGAVGDLRLQAKYSTISVQHTKSLRYTGQYTDLKAVGVSEVLDADVNYGALTVDVLGKNFSTANINAKYTDVSVGTERGAAFQFNAETNYSDLRYPAGSTIRKRQEQGSREVVEGYVGDSNAKGVVKATLNYGGFVLK